MGNFVSCALPFLILDSTSKIFLFIFFYFFSQNFLYYIGAILTHALYPLSHAWPSNICSEHSFSISRTNALPHQSLHTYTFLCMNIHLPKSDISVKIFQSLRHFTLLKSTIKLTIISNLILCTLSVCGVRFQLSTIPRTVADSNYQNVIYSIFNVPL